MRKRKDALYKSKICSLFLKKQDNYKRPNIMFPIENKLIDLVQVILLFIKKKWKFEKIIIFLTPKTKTNNAIEIQKVWKI